MVVFFIKGGNCTWQRQTYSLAELYDTILPEDFKLTMVKNPKIGKAKFYHEVTRDVYIPRISSHPAAFVQCGEKEDNADVMEEHPEVRESPSEAWFRVFITNRVDRDTSTALSLYSLRWLIETSFQDMSQNLDLHGCKWRELRGQECFLALVFLCYLFFEWVRLHGSLTLYGVDLNLRCKIWLTFANYCQKLFADWLASRTDAKYARRRNRSTNTGTLLGGKHRITVEKRSI